MEDFNKEEGFTQIVDQDPTGNYFMTRNVMVRVWLRLIGPTAFAVWSVLKSLCKGNGTVVFPVVRQKDWAEYMGISEMTLARGLNTLKEAGLLEISERSGKDRWLAKPYHYTLKKVPDEIPESLRSKVKPLSEDCKFNDQVYNPGSPIFNLPNDSDVNLNSRFTYPIDSRSTQTKNLSLYSRRTEDRRTDGSKTIPIPYGIGEGRAASGSPPSQDNPLKGNHRNLRQQEQQTIPSEEEEPISSSQGGMRERLGLPPASAFGPQPKPQRKVPTPRLTDLEEDLFDYWSHMGLRIPRKGSQSYKDCVDSLRALLKGTAFQNANGLSHLNGRKFSPEEIKRAVHNLHLAALNPDYEPSGDYKKTLASITFDKFVYNSHSPKLKSVFYRYLEEPPRLEAKAGRVIDDRVPPLTKAIKSLYVEKVVGVAPKEGWSDRDENSFRRAAGRLKDFFDEQSKNRRLQGWYDTGVGSRERQMAEYLMEALIKDAEDHPELISPGWLESDTTFHRRLPAYLLWQNVLCD